MTGTVSGMNSSATTLSDASTALARSEFPRVLFDETHQQAWTVRGDHAARMNPTHPRDASYAAAAQAATAAGFEVSAHISGPLDADALCGSQVLVIAHPSEPQWERTTGIGTAQFALSELDAIEAWVRAGGGLVVLAEHEQAKYGSNLNALLARFSIHSVHSSVIDVENNLDNVVSWVRPEVVDTHHAVLAGVSDVVMYRAGTLDSATGETVLRSRASADPAGAAMLVLSQADHGRVAVLADSDLFGDDSIAHGGHLRLWLNLLAWVSSGHPRGRGREGEELPSQWFALKNAVEELGAMQADDASLRDDADRARAAELVENILSAHGELADRFPHDGSYHTLLRADLRRWADEGFAVPDFLDSLSAFRPELARTDGREHLVVFPMYTQNGRRERRFDAVWLRVVWPEWVAELERDSYQNPAFVPIEFVDATSGYDTHSAVLFPETVTVRSTPRFSWGAIFCDRESARFRKVTASAAELLRCKLPADAAMLVNDASLAQHTYVLWDLVHDRTHSSGDLPFDPFMIKQRMPYWIYALEELRCDLNTHVEMGRLEVPHAPLVRHAIVFDRLFRFPISGDRIRNYDGLGGQIIFAYLHKTGVLHWTDNTLCIEWDRLDDAIAALAAQVNELYHAGIDRSKVGHWKACYDFVASLVAVHPASKWSNGIDLGMEARELVNAVLDDEFPLNVFYDALRKKLTGVIEESRGIRM